MESKKLAYSWKEEIQPTIDRLAEKVAKLEEKLEAHTEKKEAEIAEVNAELRMLQQLADGLPIMQPGLTEKSA